MKAWTFALLFSALLAAAPAAAIQLDLPRYMGAWHEIAHTPNFAQKGCTDTIAHYRLNDRGGFDFANTCWKGDTYKPYFGKAAPVPGPEPLSRLSSSAILRRITGYSIWIPTINGPWSAPRSGINYG